MPGGMGYGQMIGGMAGGTAGFMGGLRGNKETSYQDTTSTVKPIDESGEEAYYRQRTYNQFKDLNELADLGPGKSDVTAGYQGQKDFASMLMEMGKTGGLPSEADITASNNIADKLYGAQRLQLQQSFQDAMTNANRTAAIMGRAANDPILQNKLFQEDVRQRAMLNARQGATAQEIAMQLPGQRASYTGQGVNVLSGLATQAFQNRAALLSQGSNLQQLERQWRLNTATRTNNQSITTGHEGSLLDAIQGNIAGSAAGLGAGSAMDSSMPNSRGAGGQQMGFSNVGFAQGGMGTYSGGNGPGPWAAGSQSFNNYAPGSSSPGPWAPQGNFGSFSLG